MNGPTHDVTVWLYGRHIGTITRRAGRVSFTYTPEHLADPNATPLSLSMPTAIPTHKARPIMAYLDGLLPDNAEVRRRWARRFNIKDGDVLSLIGHIGTDTAGAAIFTPPNTPPPTTGDLVPIGDRELAARLRRLRETGVDWQEEDEHWSLAGAQGKFTLTRTPDGQWARPTGALPSTHIIKPGIGRLAAQAMVEHVTMRAFAHAGLEVAKTEHVEVAGEPAIIVTRYDRRTRPDGLAQVHQEDLCQGHGIVPSKKYAADGGPDVGRISTLLRQYDPASNRRFAAAVVANYLAGCPDAHAKNYSVFLAAKQVRLTPLYDVATGVHEVGDGGTRRFARAAMAVGGENRFGLASRTNWDRFARAVALDADEVTSIVTDLAGQLPDAFTDALAELPASKDRDRLARVLPGLVAEQCRYALASLGR